MADSDTPALIDRPGEVCTCPLTSGGVDPLCNRHGEADPPGPLTVKVRLRNGGIFELTRRATYADFLRSLSREIKAGSLIPVDGGETYGWPHINAGEIVFVSYVRGQVA